MTTERRLSFGSAAAAYERFRPAYPDAVVDAVLDHATIPVRTALEIGAGTGKATRLFDARGIAVTATEPEADMLTELRGRVSNAVTTLQASLESLTTTDTFDLVYAASALHWTQAEHRWERIAALLMPGGVFASFGGPVRLVDAGLADAVRTARRPWLADDDVPSPDGTPETETMQWPGTELLRSPWFTDVRQLVIPRRLTVSAEDYVGTLSTVSAYLQLSADDRRQALDAVAATLPATVELTADLPVHLATAVAVEGRTDDRG